jgi:hypothetical protein
VNNLSRKLILNLLAICLIHVVLAMNGIAQTSTAAQKHQGLAHLQDLEKRFGPHFATRLSSGGANSFRASRMLAKLQARGVAMQPRHANGALEANARARLLAGPSAQTGRRPAFPVIANNPNFDYDSTRLTGFSQSETSSAWCGSSVVVGFNDSAAFAHTAVDGQAAAISLSGVAVSHDGGNSFTGLPFLNPGPALNPGSPFFDSELVGDPVVVCSDAQNFYYSSIQEQVPVDAQGNVIAAFANMAVNRSTDGGVTWDDPVTAIRKDATEHFLDKEWLAIDRHNPNNLYLTYTDFQNHGIEPDCASGGGPGIASGPDVALEMVASHDGGLTWGAPVRFARQCSLELGENLTGTQVAVGPHGEVYVAYASILFSLVRGPEIVIRRSDDGGNTFGPEVVVGEPSPAANPFVPELQGNFRTNLFPMLAVDHSAGPHNGSLYMVWTDASQNVTGDLLVDFLNNDANCVADGCGGYAFGDILFSRSLDNGNTWSSPSLVSPTPANFQGAGRDQFMSGVAVDHRGNLAICYSDRRNDPNNFLVDHYCSVSHDQGVTFSDIRETPTSWEPNTGTDGVINPVYMGDYDTATSDVTGENAGFYNTFQIQTNGNPDVFGFKLPD